MRAWLKRTWEMRDHSKHRDHAKTNVKPGVYELERIPNPYGLRQDWLIIKGTTIGMAEVAWRQWQNGPIDNPGSPNHGKAVNRGDWEIVIEE
jgi:hypothetical protein